MIRAKSVVMSHRAKNDCESNAPIGMIGLVLKLASSSYGLYSLPETTQMCLLTGLSPEIAASARIMKSKGARDQRTSGIRSGLPLYSVNK